ncbi:MAG: G/U mismatch-specific DNA glycosylase [Planctomycetes bacterium]|nr:G/U mismatch-specific DNA glycosylase [Planctomycetota bacterium]
MTSPHSPWKPTAGQIAAAAGKTIPDVIADRLEVLLVGINPSLYSAAVGHHFARPGNRFWQALHEGGFSPRLFTPWEDRRLIEHGVGLTNIVPRATARADQLSPHELKAGAQALERKVRRRQPKCVAMLGVTAFREAYSRKRAVLGRQDESLAGAMIWVLPNPSGLNAHYQRADFARLFGELREAVDLLKGST